MTEAWIEKEFEVKVNPLSGKQVFSNTYKWVGTGEVAELGYSEVVHHLYANPNFLDGDVITLGELRLRIIDRNAYGIGYLVVARDGWKAHLYKVVWPTRRWFLWFWYRLVWTLVVWGLAECTPGMAPSWRDIKVLKWLAEKWGLL